MKKCSYCGRENDQEAQCCCGCGSPFAQMLTAVPFDPWHYANSVRSSTYTDFRPDISFSQCPCSTLALSTVWQPGHLRDKNCGKNSGGVCFSASPPLSW